MRAALIAACLLSASLPAAGIEEMKQRSGARSLALAEAGAAALEGHESLAWNPAGISRIQAPIVAFGHTSWVLGLNTEALDAVASAGSWGALGFAGAYLNSGPMDQRDATGAKDSTYTYSTIGGELSWAKELMPALSLGVGVGYWQQSAAGKGTGQVALSSGLQVRQLGFVLGLAGVRLADESRAWQASLAKGFILGGVDFGLSGGLILEGVDSRYGGGLEADLGRAVALRVGYQAPVQKAVIQGLQGLTAGLGFELGPVAVDYGYLPLGEIGQVHRLGLSYAWLDGSRKGESPVTTAPAVTNSPDSKPLPAKEKKEVELRFTVPAE